MFMVLDAKKGKVLTVYSVHPVYIHGSHYEAMFLVLDEDKKTWTYQPSNKFIPIEKDRNKDEILTKQKMTVLEEQKNIWESTGIETIHMLNILIELFSENKKCPTDLEDCVNKEEACYHRWYEDRREDFCKKHWWEYLSEKAR